ncbi:MAG: YeeE/YedE family protein [Halobacteriovoraceae bacterium]|nr:YeeE/YedE family protein [Halobacteriovoraceae bacterium]
MNLIYGFITGIFFGFLLSKGQVLKYDRQIAAMQFKDMTIFKFMLSSIAVSMVGLYLFSDLGFITLNIKGFSWGAQVVGGLVFGIGWGILGYCPGTATGALAEGRVDALWGMGGMITGGLMYGFIYPLVKPILHLGKAGKLTLSDALGLNHWIVIVFALAFIGGVFWFFEKKKI